MHGAGHQELRSELQEPRPHVFLPGRRARALAERALRRTGALCSLLWSKGILASTVPVRVHHTCDYTYIYNYKGGEKGRPINSGGVQLYGIFKIP